MTVVGSSLALDRVAVTTALPLFSAISVADVVKVTTGASSSLILTSSEDSAESSIFWGSAKAIEIVSIDSSKASSSPVKTNDTDWDPAGTVIVSVTELV